MKTYICKTDRRTRYLTLVHFAVIAALAAALALLYEGGYLSAWFLSFMLALAALMALSVPRKLTLSDSTLYIRCILDITEIPFADIDSVRTVERKDMRWMFPIFGAYGMLGYYGHYLDLRTLRHVEIYASTWDNFVEITTIYEKTYFVSCAERDELVAILRENKPQRDTVDELQE